MALTRYSDDAYLQELLRAGVAGYVLKQSPSIELLQAIRAAAGGGQYLDSTVTGRVTNGFLARDGRKTRQAQPVHHRQGSGGAPPDREGLQQQGNRGAARSQRQDGRGAQGERDAEARVSRTNRYRPVRHPSGLDAGWVENTGPDCPESLGVSPDTQVASSRYRRVRHGCHTRWMPNEFWSSGARLRSRR